jgi:hypothetical protein
VEAENPLKGEPPGLHAREHEQAQGKAKIDPTLDGLHSFFTSRDICVRRVEGKNVAKCSKAENMQVSRRVPRAGR